MTVTHLARVRLPLVTPSKLSDSRCIMLFNSEHGPVWSKALGLGPRISGVQIPLLRPLFKDQKVVGSNPTGPTIFSVPG